MDDYYFHIDQQLLSAYQNTRYEVEAPRFSIIIGRHHPHMDEWLLRHSFTSWAFITAANPASLPLSDPVNQNRNRALASWIESAGWKCYAGAGIPMEGDWIPESSWWVPGLSVSLARFLGQSMGQLAVVWGERHQPARLISCY